MNDTLQAKPPTNWSTLCCSRDIYQGKLKLKNNHLSAVI